MSVSGSNSSTKRRGGRGTDGGGIDPKLLKKACEIVLGKKGAEHVARVYNRLASAPPLPVKTARPPIHLVSNLKEPELSAPRTPSLRIIR